MTANEIWTVATEKSYDKQLKSEGKTPCATLGAQIYVNAKDNPKAPFAQTDSRPKKFYLKSQAAQLDLSETAVTKEPTTTKKKRFDYLEKDLHPYLTYYAYYHLHCYTKTINHSQSSQKEFGSGFIRTLLAVTFLLTTGKRKLRTKLVNWQHIYQTFIV